MKIQKIAMKLIGLKFNIIGLFSPTLALNQALTLFSKPRNGRILSFQKKHLDSFTKQTIEVSNVKIQTYQKGKGNYTILLAHGWESNAWRWRKFIQFLGLEDYTYIALDAPGHGASQPDYFDLKLYAEAINNIVIKQKPNLIIGHSIGGLAVLLTCALYNNINHDIKIITMGSPHSLASIFQKYFKAIALSTRIQSKIEQFFLHKYNMKLDEFSIDTMAKTIQNEGLIIHDKNDVTNEIGNALSIDKAWKSGHLIITNSSNHSMQNEEIFNLIKNYAII
jgi:esterase/lipase